MASTYTPPLAGNDVEVINRNAGILIAGLFAAAITGWCVDRFFCERHNRSSREPGWVKLLLLTSYAYLVPGLLLCLFSFNMVIYVSSNNRFGLGPGGGFNKTPGTTETMVGLIKLLHETGSDIGAVAVLFYAIVIPVVKLVLLFVGNMGHGVEKCSVLSRRSIQCVQNISKWACPDMFAYILLMNLVRSLNLPPSFISVGRLDLGFTCFSLFCVGSTIASIGIRVPDREHGCWQAIGKLLGKKYLIFVVVILELAFLVLFFMGAGQSVMALRIGKVNSFVDMTMKLLGLSGKLKADVTIWSALSDLLISFSEGEVNSILGFFMLAVFVVGITLLDMIVLGIVTVLLTTNKPAGRWMNTSWVLKKLSMLDVSCMGVFVVTLCMMMYRDVGVIVTMGTGQWLLVAAEVLHYITYYTVKGTIEHLQPNVCLGNPFEKDAKSDYGGEFEDSEETSEGENKLDDESEEDSSNEVC